MKPLPTFLIAFLWPFIAWSQVSPQAQLRGRILDADSHLPVSGASIALILAKDSSRTPYAVISDERGRYQIPSIGAGKYKVFVSFLGYQQILWGTTLSVDTAQVSLPDIFLKKKYIELSQVEIIETRPPITLKKDTTEFSAVYYKTREFSAVGDLLKKIPGLEVAADGTITVNGVVVKQILIDGKPYFGNDTKMATRNLLAGMIEKIQLIDRKPSSEDMGTTGNPALEKAINLTLKKDRYGNLTGLASVGYGTDDRYSARTTLNRFSAHQQIALVGGADNTNYFPENMGTSPTNGGTANWNAGLNFNQDLSPKLSLNSSYTVSGETSTVENSSRRQNFLKDSSFLSQQNSMAKSTSTTHTLDLSLKYQLDTSSYIAVINRLSYAEKSNELENDFSTTSVTGAAINGGKTDNNSRSHNLFYLTNWTYSKTFDRPGQVLITGFNYSHGNAPGQTFNRSKTRFNLPDGLESADSLDQLNDQRSTNSIFQLTLNYAQPLFKDHFLDMGYIYTNFNTRTDKAVYGTDSPKSNYTVLIDSLSADFRTITASQYRGLAFRSQKDRFDYSLGIGIIQNRLNNTMLSGHSSLQKNLLNIFPTASLNYQIKRNLRLHFDYNRNVQPPAPAQLQPVPDNSNPLFLQLGNPDLKPSTQDYFNFSLRSFNPRSLLNLNFNASVGLLGNQVVNDLLTDSIGRQISRPVNISGSRMYSFYANASIPLKSLKTSVNASTSWKTNKDFSINNRVQSLTIKNIVCQTLSFNYTHKEWFDLMSFFSITYSTADYELQQSRYQYFDYSFSFAGNLNLPLGFTLGTNMGYTLQSGRASGYNTDMLIVNAMIAKYLLKGQRGQIKLQVFDLLDRNSSRQRSVGDNYIEDTQTTPLKRFALLSFVYYLKKR